MKTFLITWIFAGILTFLIDNARKRLPNETSFPFWRAIFSGWLGFVIITGLVLFPPTPINNEQERRFYDNENNQFDKSEEKHPTNDSNDQIL